MMGLEKLLRGLYGTAPQIDLDRQIARARVPKPMTLDFAGLADGFRRNNVGVAGIKVEAAAELKSGAAVIQPSGQSFRLKEGADAPAKRRAFRVLNWKEPDKTVLEILE